MNADPNPHVPEEVLERYAMGKLSEEESIPLEEHLLVCPICQTRLGETDEYLRTVKAAIQTLPSASASKLSHAGFSRSVRIPKPIWSVGLAAVILLLTVPAYRRAIAPSGVTLTSVRGAPSFPRTQGREQLRLNIDVTEIREPDGYQLEIVDPKGNPVWHAYAEGIDDQIEAVVPKRLQPGRYWVRLYDTGGPWKLLREFGLDVE